MDLQHSAIWIASVYLMLLMHLLENKVAVDLTRSEFVEAQEVCFLALSISVHCHSISQSSMEYLLKMKSSQLTNLIR